MFKLFKQRLLKTGIPTNNIISIALDDDQQRELRDPYALSDYVRQRCTNPQEKYVLLLDEIQYAIAKDELKNTNEPVKRYNIKNKRYFEYPSKFYCTDIGLRNVRLGLRQQEETHIMENLIYNELRMRGFAVDVGNIDVFEKTPAESRCKRTLRLILSPEKEAGNITSNLR